jgi:hypothetical protein
MVVDMIGKGLNGVVREEKVRGEVTKGSLIGWGTPRGNLTRVKRERRSLLRVCITKNLK